jgi:hypothetical protein
MSVTMRNRVDMIPATGLSKYFSSQSVQNMVESALPDRSFDSNVFAANDAARSRQ